MDEESVGNAETIKVTVSVSIATRTAEHSAELPSDAASRSLNAEERYIIATAAEFALGIVRIGMVRDGVSPCGMRDTDFDLIRKMQSVG